MRQAIVMVAASHVCAQAQGRAKFWLEEAGTVIAFTELGSSHTLGRRVTNQKEPGGDMVGKGT